VVVQVALSVVLLGGAGLFIRSLGALESVDVGFAPQGILTLEVTPERELYGTARWFTLQNEIADRVRLIPGVQSAGWATMSPLSGRDRGARVAVPGFTPRSETDKEIHLAAISANYFDVMGMPLLMGHDFMARDEAGAPKVAILNEAATRFYFGDANPTGRKIQFTNYPGRDMWYEVKGVVSDAKHDSLREPPPRFIYLPIPQSADRINRLTLAVRCAGDALAFAAPVRREIRRARSTLLIANVSTMERQIAQSLVRERLVAGLSATFGAVALVLAGIGLYGMLSYAVARRANEIGVRMALGATRRGVVWLVLREALVLAAGGIAIGFPVVMVLGRAIRALLYGVTPVDPFALSAAALLLIAFAVIAAIVPGRRASRLDPMSALRRD
jgi:predicted permease